MFSITIGFLITQKSDKVADKLNTESKLTEIEQKFNFKKIQAIHKSYFDFFALVVVFLNFRSNFVSSKLYIKINIDVQILFSYLIFLYFRKVFFSFFFLFLFLLTETYIINRIR